MATEEQTQPMTSLDKFWLLLANYPFLERFWDKDDRSVRMTALKRAIPKMSTGEAIVARIVLAIWRGNATDAGKIDITDFAGCVDARSRKPIIDWLCSPFWP